MQAAGGGELSGGRAGAGVVELARHVPVALGAGEGGAGAQMQPQIIQGKAEGGLLDGRGRARLHERAAEQHHLARHEGADVGPVEGKDLQGLPVDRHVMGVHPHPVRIFHGQALHGERAEGVARQPLHPQLAGGADLHAGERPRDGQVARVGHQGEAGEDHQSDHPRHQGAGQHGHPAPPAETASRGGAPFRRGQRLRRAFRSRLLHLGRRAGLGLDQGHQKACPTER